MAQNSKKSRGVPSTAPENSDAVRVDSASPDEVLVCVRELLRNGQPERALERIRQARVQSDWLTNAAGVCQIRLGNADGAVQTFRGLVISGGIRLRDDIPALFKLNFAVALLAAGNLDGFLSTMKEIQDPHPAIDRYREAYLRWKQSLSSWDRFKMALGGRPPRPFTPEFPLGEV